MAGEDVDLDRQMRVVDREDKPPLAVASLAEQHLRLVAQGNRLDVWRQGLGDELADLDESPGVLPPCIVVVHAGDLLNAVQRDGQLREVLDQFRSAGPVGEDRDES